MEISVKRTALAIAAALATLLAAAWYGLPALLKPPLLAAKRATAGLNEQTVSAAQHTIHYLDSGPRGGPDVPVLLLHGIFAEKDHWVDFARALPRPLRIVAPDLPGFGESGRLDGQAYDYDEQVRRLLAFMDALGIAQAHLAGSSMGGTLAALLAIQHPERVRSVAFIGSPHGIRSPRASPMDRQIDAGQAPLVARDATEFDAMMKLVFAQPPFLPYPILKSAQMDALRLAGSNQRLWNAQLKDRYLLDARMAQLRQPVFALWGTDDQVFDVSGAGVLRDRLPQARIITMPGVGHLPMMEKPGDSAAAYADYLAGLVASSPEPRSATMR